MPWALSSEPCKEAGATRGAGCLRVWRRAMPKAQGDDLVMNLVELTLAHLPDSRAAFLRAACDGDTELFSQVWEYVEWNHRMQDFLLEPMYPGLCEHRFAPGDLLADRFRIVRKVAQGGMGVVYEAEDE